jgi:hypothetical protein
MTGVGYDEMPLPGAGFIAFVVGIGFIAELYC